MLLLNFPIEPIANRYSKEWDRWFQCAFMRNNIKSFTFLGKQTSQPNSGDFVNPISTWKWRFEQMVKAAEFLEYYRNRQNRDKIVIFLQDGWFPGTEAFEFMSTFGDLDIRVCAYWHGGSYLGTDILNQKYCEWWSRESERSWLKIAYNVFVGSQYHKKQIDCVRSDRIRVVGCPIEVDYPAAIDRERVVIWPHRKDPMKNPEIFDFLANDTHFKDVKFIKTIDVCKTKEEYHALLATAKVAVSTAAHETFGISMVEAAIMGCHPVVPDNLSYPELFPAECRYNSYSEMVELIVTALDAPEAYHNPKGRFWNYPQQAVTDIICAHLIEAGK